MLFKMAWRNIWRNKRRSFITCFSVGFGFFLALSLTGIAEHSYTRTIDTGAQMGFGHVTVAPEGYMDKPALDRRLVKVDGVRDLALAKPEVRGAVVRVVGQAMFGAGGRTRGGQFIAIDPTREDTASNLFIKNLVEGEVFGSAGERGAIIGVKMAEKLKLELGKKLIYTATDVNGEIVSDVVRVKGIFKTGVREVDGGVVVLPIGKVRETLGYTRDEATLVAVMLRNQHDTERVREALMAEIDSPGAEVQTWRKTQPDLAGLLAVDWAMNRLFQFLVGLLIAAGVLNTLYMSVMERRREFGVMMAIGMSPRKLFALVIAESLLIGVLGMALGGLGTIPWYNYMVETGIDLTEMMGEGYDIGGIAEDPIARMHLPPDLLVIISLALFGMTLLAGMYPAWVAGRIPPVESLRIV